jgi:hypothetical protein
MGFDISTARPVRSGGFDLSTAVPESQWKTKQAQQAPPRFTPEQMKAFKADALQQTADETGPIDAFGVGVAEGVLKLGRLLARVSLAAWNWLFLKSVKPSNNLQKVEQARTLCQVRAKSRRILNAL